MKLLILSQLIRVRLLDFVTSQAKKQIVYVGRGDLNGVCINNFIKTEPDF